MSLAVSIDEDREQELFETATLDNLRLIYRDRSLEIVPQHPETKQEIGKIIVDIPEEVSGRTSASLSQSLYTDRSALQEVTDANQQASVLDPDILEECLLKAQRAGCSIRAYHQNGTSMGFNVPSIVDNYAHKVKTRNLQNNLESFHYTIDRDSVQIVRTKEKHESQNSQDNIEWYDITYDATDQLQDVDGAIDCILKYQPDVFQQIAGTRRKGKIQREFLELSFRTVYPVDYWENHRSSLIKRNKVFVLVHPTGLITLRQKDDETVNKFIHDLKENYYSHSREESANDDSNLIQLQDGTTRLPPIGTGFILARLAERIDQCYVDAFNFLEETADDIQNALKPTRRDGSRKKIDQQEQDLIDTSVLRGKHSKSLWYMRKQIHEMADMIKKVRSVYKIEKLNGIFGEELLENEAIFEIRLQNLERFVNSLLSRSHSAEKADKSIKEEANRILQEHVAEEQKSSSKRAAILTAIVSAVGIFQAYELFLQHPMHGLGVLSISLAAIAGLYRFGKKVKNRFLH